MKKSIIAVLVCFFGLTQMSAQDAQDGQDFQVTFRPGLRTGLNCSKLTYMNTDFRPDLYIGGYGALKLTKFYTFQPEITYSRQGANNVMVSRYDADAQVNIIEEKDVSISYVSVGLMSKFTFSDKFNFHFGHTLDLQEGQNYYTNSDADITFMAGLGWNVNKNLAIEGRLKKGIIDVFNSSYDFSDSNYNYNGNYNTNFLFQLGLSYTFDIKQ